MTGLPATVTLRSRAGQDMSAQVLRMEPWPIRSPKKNLGQGYVRSAAGTAATAGRAGRGNRAVASAARRAGDPKCRGAARGRRTGRMAAGRRRPALHAHPVGRKRSRRLVQVRSGLAPGDRVVVYSEKALNNTSRIHVVERLARSPS